jgi:hypothetical protein
MNQIVKVVQHDQDEVELFMMNQVINGMLRNLKENKRILIDGLLKNNVKNKEQKDLVKMNKQLQLWLLSLIYKLQ